MVFSSDAHGQELLFSTDGLRVESAFRFDMDVDQPVHIIYTIPIHLTLCVLYFLSSVLEHSVNMMFLRCVIQRGFCLSISLSDRGKIIALCGLKSRGILVSARWGICGWESLLRAQGIKIGRPLAKNAATIIHYSRT